jgi:hypothetical protein
VEVTQEENYLLLIRCQCVMRYACDLDFKLYRRTNSK